VYLGNGARVAVASDAITAAAAFVDAVSVYVAHKLIAIAHLSEGRLSLERHNAEKERTVKYTHFFLTSIKSHLGFTLTFFPAACLTRPSAFCRVPQSDDEGWTQEKKKPFIEAEAPPK
jgi:hypothetical protein